MHQSIGVNSIGKQEAVDRLVQWQFASDPGLLLVYRAIAADEDDPLEPIKLLAVSEDAMETEDFTAFGFAPTKEFPYRTIIAEVTPVGLARLVEAGKLPPVWNLSTATRYRR